MGYYNTPRKPRGSPTSKSGGRVRPGSGSRGESSRAPEQSSPTPARQGVSVGRVIKSEGRKVGRKKTPKKAVDDREFQPTEILSDDSGPVEMVESFLIPSLCS